MLEAEIMLSGPAWETGLRAHPQVPTGATEVQGGWSLGLLRMVPAGLDKGPCPSSSWEESGKRYMQSSREIDGCSFR